MTEGSEEAAVAWLLHLPEQEGAKADLDNLRGFEAPCFCRF